jgi:CRISPR system Cascade subunit CasC
MSKTPRFIQIHTLHSYPAALLNRDDAGLAKRLQYGGYSRTRVSSQCLKRHWRTAEGADAWSEMEGFIPSIRSRELVSKLVIEPILSDTSVDDKIAKALSDEFQVGVYGKNATDPKKRQPLLLGAPEVEYLKRNAMELLEHNSKDSKALTEAIKAFFKEEKKNLGALKEQATLPGGLAAALFGRMVTSDPAANIDAAIHVAHAFTVHAEESESDYFSVVDDLRDDDDDAGAAHIGDSELTAGLFYGYVVVDVPALVSNTQGVKSDQWAAQDTDRELAAEIIKRLINLIATVTPGAKLGSTAPYSWAPLVFVEAGERQPRSFAEAFRKPCAAQLDKTLARLTESITQFDECYGATESRRFCCIDASTDLPDSARLPLANLADWASDAVLRAEV